MQPRLYLFRWDHCFVVYFDSKHYLLLIFVIAIDNLIVYDQLLRSFEFLLRFNIIIQSRSLYQSRSLFLLECTKANPCGFISLIIYLPRTEKALSSSNENYRLMVSSLTVGKLVLPSVASVYCQQSASMYLLNTFLSLLDCLDWILYFSLFRLFITTWKPSYLILWYTTTKTQVTPASSD